MLIPLLYHEIPSKTIYHMLIPLLYHEIPSKTTFVQNIENRIISYVQTTIYKVSNHIVIFV